MRRSCSRRAPVARPWTSVGRRAAARWREAARPTPVSRFEVRTTLRPDSTARPTISLAGWRPPNRAALRTRTPAERDLMILNASSRVERDSSAAMGIEDGDRSLLVAGSSMYSGWNGARRRMLRTASPGFQAWFASRRSLISGPTAARTARRASSSCWTGRPPTLSLRVVKPSATACRARRAVSRGEAGPRTALVETGCSSPPRRLATGRSFDLPMASSSAVSRANRREGLEVAGSSASASFSSPSSPSPKGTGASPIPVTSESVRTQINREKRVRTVSVEVVKGLRKGTPTPSQLMLLIFTFATQLMIIH